MAPFTPPDNQPGTIPASYHAAPEGTAIIRFGSGNEDFVSSPPRRSVLLPGLYPRRRVGRNAFAKFIQRRKRS